MQPQRTSKPELVLRPVPSDASGIYLAFYQLSQQPFQISTDPAFLWLGEKHAEALATLKYGILEDKGFLLLTGEVGTGKTALTKLLIRKIDVSALVATIPDPGMEALDFFNFLAEEFKMDRHFASKGAFLIEFKQFLLNAYSSQRKVLLIIDEAQRLTPEMLEQVRLLSNIELDHRKLINIFFVGQPEVNRTLLDERCKAVRQRITVSHHIEPLNETETRQYVLHRLKVAGARRGIFTQDAIRQVYDFSQGYPRLINIICDHALMSGYGSGSRIIDGRLIRECEAELRVPELQAAQLRDPLIATEQKSESLSGDLAAPKFFGWRFPLLLVLLILLGFTIYMVYDYQTDPPQRWATEDLVPHTYKGLSGRPFPLETEEAPVTVAVPPAPPPVAVAPAGSPLEAVPSETLRINPFAKGKIIIFFPYNSNELREEVLAALDQIALFLQVEKNLKVQIAGYTDSVGPVTYNVNVSQFRANSVKSYLTGKGVDPANLVAIGLGPKDPIASNDTPEGRQKNRRVEIEPIRD
jgi:general secretion pathway protein A